MGDDNIWLWIAVDDAFFYSILMQIRSDYSNLTAINLTYI